MTRHRLIDELAAVLGEADADDQSSQQSNLTRAASILGRDQAGVRELLDSVRNDRSLAREVADRSYWHSNGFAKLVLHAGHRPDLRLRLHVWGSAKAGPARPGYQNVHNHRWPFASVVLCGGIAVDEFEETAGLDDPRALPCQKFGYATGPGHTAPLVALADAALRPTKSAVYGRSDLHCCDTGKLHIVTPMAATTATILIQGKAAQDQALVYQWAGRPPIEDTGSRIGATEVTDLVSETLAAMNHSAG